MLQGKQNKGGIAGLSKKLKSVYKTYPFSNMSKWQKFKLWLKADVPYFFDKIWYRLTGKWLLK